MEDASLFVVDKLIQVSSCAVSGSRALRKDRIVQCPVVYSAVKKSESYNNCRKQYSLSDTYSTQSG